MTSFLAARRQLAGLAAWLRGSRLGRKLTHSLPLLVALLPALFASERIIRKIPLSHDHATHLFKAWHFWTELVPSGRLRGWSHLWGFGFPSDELVPCGGEVWVGLFRLLSLGQLSWARTYAVSFAGLLVFKSYAAYRFGRSFFGATVGVIAAWLTFFDPGGMLEGGWEWHTNWGVWPVTLAASFVQLALVRLDRVLRDCRRGDVALAGTLTAFAILTHQISIVAFAVAVPLLFADRLLRPGKVGVSAYARTLGALAFGLALSAFFLVPFFTHTVDSLDLGWLNEPLPVIVARLFEGKTFQNTPLPVHFLGLLGVCLALRAGARGHLFFAASALACVLLASDVLVRVLHLERVMPSLVKLEMNRLLLVAKLFWFPLVGFALTELVRFAKGTFSTDSAGKRVVRLALVAGLVLPLFAVGGRKFSRAELSQQVTGREDLPDWRDFQELLGWSRALPKNPLEPYRIAYDIVRGNHLPTVLPVYDQTPLYVIGTTPTQIFKSLPRAADPELYAAMGVKYVVRVAPIDAPYLKPLKRFGGLLVYEFTRYRPEPFSVIGAGSAELVEFSSERIRIRLRGTNAATRLKLHVASYSRWRATLDGAVLPITTVPVYGFRYPFLMEVPARNGEIRFEYVRLPADWLGLLISLAAVPVLLSFSYFRGGGGRGFERLLGALAAQRRSLVVASLLLATLGVVAVATRLRTRAALLPKSSLFQTLADGELRYAGADCHALEPLVYQCGSYRLEADAVASAIWGVHLCMHGPRVGALELRARRRLGAFLSGSYDEIADGEGHVRVRLDGQELASFATEPAYLQQQFLAFDTRDRNGETALVELSLEGSALDCFDFGASP